MRAKYRDFNYGSGRRIWGEEAEEDCIDVSYEDYFAEDEEDEYYMGNEDEGFEDDEPYDPYENPGRYCLRPPKVFLERKHFESTNCPRMSSTEAARRWKMTGRRVRQLCKAGRIFSARKVDGVWTIPESTQRPIDGRVYGHKTIPPELRQLVRFADMAVRDAWERLRSDASDKINGIRPLNFFIQGSAHHLHKTAHSSLTFADVKEVLAGRAVGGKSIRDQIAVMNHDKAARFMFDSLAKGMPLTSHLVKCINSILTRGWCADDIPAKGRLESLLREARAGGASEIVLTAKFMTKFMIGKPFKEQNERTAYFTANYILMKGGYPPILLYRKMFRAYRKYWENRKNVIPGYARERYVKRSNPAFFAKAIACAVRHSCKIGLLKALP